MSIRAIDWAWKQRLGKPSAKLVLAKLADYANDDGKCWPSLRTIGIYTELSRDTVLRAIRFLESKKLLTVIRRGNGRSALSNVYQLNYRSERLTDSAESSAKLIQKDRGTSRPLPAKSSDGLVAQSHQGSHMIGLGVVAPSDLNRHIEPSIKPLPPIVPQRGTGREDFIVAKEWLNKLFGRKLAWSHKEDQLLSALLPITLEERALLSWAYTLPRDPEGWAWLSGHRTSKPKQSLVILLREFASEIDKWRSVRSWGRPTKNE